MNGRRPSLTSLVVFGFAILAVGYPLSYGPLCLLLDAGFLHEDDLVLMDVLATVYAPLVWCQENVEWVSAFYDWYLFDLLGFSG